MFFVLFFTIFAADRFIVCFYKKLWRMKKKVLSILLMLLPLATCVGAIQIDGIYYNLATDTRQAEVTGTYNDYSGAVVIPAVVSYNGFDYDVTRIGEKAFFMCRGLTSVVIPSSVTSMGANAFNGCKGLTSITIPDGLTVIANSLFCGCSGLKSITIPAGVTEIGQKAFSGCMALSYLTLPASVTTIGDAAFESCTSLTTFGIPEGVTRIGKGTFMYCNSLFSVHIPASVTSIGDEAFAYCNNLTSVAIPEGVTSIANYVFNGCSSLTSVTIPAGVISIGEFAFYDCMGLKQVYCLPKDVPATATTVFRNVEIRPAILHVPSQSIEAYQTTVPWNGFGTIVAVTTDIEEVQGAASGVQCDKVYNLQGQRVINPTNGLYIVNGRKVVIR